MNGSDFPETGNSMMITGLISPEIIEERIQYYKDDNSIENTETWTTCQGYTLDFALKNGSTVIASDDNWIYVITGNKKKIKFDKKSNEQYVQI